jgi:1-pyrroline-5-carboxylate dehydrogenase
MIGEFRNEPLTDFTKPENVAAFEAALEKVGRQLGKSHPIVIGGRRIRDTKETFPSVNPSNHKEVVASFAKATPALANRAVEAAAEAFEDWRWAPARERASILFRAARMIRQRRHELSAWMVYEVGKSWPEADGDTAQAIDFCEFYGRQAIRLAQPQPLGSVPGEDNELKYIPLGVAIVVPPWNFPFAIMAGLTAASVASGNCVVLKPSSDAPTIAWKFFEILEEAGIPDGVVNFLPGSGGAIGDLLVEHPLTRLIAFTGSKEIGLRIAEKAGRISPGQIWIKRTILEMGGKDFTLVDEDADFDAAVAGTIAGAFGFQGQKCSANSRTIVHEKIHKRFVEAVAAKVDKLSVGDPRDRKNFMGPVINARQFDSIRSYIRVGRREGKLVAGGTWEGRPGWFIRPTVFDGIKRTARLFREEIFGPVLAVTKARNYEEMIALANHSEYGLTGSYFGSDRAKITLAKRLLHCGNLFINRKCTGVLVDVHPLGGFNMSGTDSKAGGRDYLLLFTQAKSISEQL